jgi:hypothetical protein
VIPAFFLLSWMRARELGPPAFIVLALYTFIAVWWLPPLAELGLAAGPRVVVDLGLSGLRLACGGLAIAAGHGALGPPLRRGEADLFYTLPRGPAVWPLARLAGSVAVGWAHAAAGFVAWWALHRVIVGDAPGHLSLEFLLALGGWFGSLWAEVGLLVLLSAATGLWLRGPAGPLAAITVTTVGHLSLFLEDVPWHQAPIARALATAVPQLWRLDLTSAVMFPGALDPFDLAGRIGYGGLWAMALGTAAWWTARPPRRVEGHPWNR